jgi:hypothetical protein
MKVSNKIVPKYVYYTNLTSKIVSKKKKALGGVRKPDIEK